MTGARLEARRALELTGWDRARGMYVTGPADDSDQVPAVNRGECWWCFVGAPHSANACATLTMNRADLFERDYPDDPRPRRAIEVARLRADGLATDEQRAAARAAERQWQTTRLAEALEVSS